MIINKGNLDTLFTGFKANFATGLAMAPTDHLRVATPVPSTTGKEEYGWLGKFPSVREWVGDRVIQNLKQHAYTIRNKDFELTVAVDRNDIEDDNLGIYGPMFTEMGQSTGAKKCQLVYSLLKDGFSTECYDGQFFFDTDHPVLNEAGQPVPVANTDGGSGTPWFLIDAGRALKPIILQERKEFALVRKDDPADDNVFMRREFLYGADARMNVGFGFWQMAWGSRQALTPTSYAAARGALMGMKGDYGRALGIMPNLLVVPPSLEGAARKILGNQLTTAGETNEWYNTAQLLVTPWLA
ncbi:MAG: Mu-like prophage major head subunit gpT family protein [Sphingomonadaceae bacterium]